MNITGIKIRRIFTEGELKAIMSITFDDQLVVHDIKLIKNGDRTIVAMPNRKTNTGFVDVVHPINYEFRTMIEKEVLQAYSEEVILK